MSGDLTSPLSVFDTRILMPRLSTHPHALRLMLVVVPLLAVITASPAQQANQGGIAGGEVHAPIFDELNRPITAGGFKKDAPVFFADVTAGSGLEAFRQRSGDPEKKYIIATMTGGVAVIDYDRDGWADIYLVNGSTYEALQGREEHQISRLFRNNGDGTFRDVTEKAGVPNREWGFGATAGDFDNDGWVDLYVSNLGSNRLYRNNHDGTFTDVAEAAGVQLSEAWTTGASFGDYDSDGDLDLFVCGYAKFSLASPPQPGVDIPINYCQFRGDDVMCGPRGLKGERDFLFRNNGNGTFSEVSDNAGVPDLPGYYGFSCSWVDVNNDHRLDLVVINDSTPNYLYLNNGDGTFQDVSYVSGFALNRDGREQAGMGLAIGDYNRDGLIDFFITHFSDDYCALYQNEDDAFFLDLSNEVGLEAPTLPFVSWGTAFVDFDNDGFQDLFIANGHVYPGVDKRPWGTTWAERPLLFRNLAGHRFEEMPPAVDSGLAVITVGRGAGFADFDHDGRLDVVMNCIDSSPRLLRNVTKTENHWSIVKLIPKQGPADAVGATLYLTAGGVRQRADVFTGASFMSNSDPRQHFGLGSSTSIERLEIFWPSGERQVLEGLPVDRLLEISEGQASAVVSSLPGGWKRTARQQ